MHDARQVYAGCLTESAQESLSALGLGSLVALKMDVTKEQEVQAVMRAIERDEEGNGQGTGLYCLVNNAGRTGA